MLKVFINTLLKTPVENVENYQFSQVYLPGGGDWVEP